MLILFCFVCSVALGQSDTVMSGVNYFYYYGDSVSNGWLEKKTGFNYSKLKTWTGKYIAFYKNGTLRATGQIESDCRSGHWITYYQNGQKESEGVYDKKYREVGKWEYYFENGTFKGLVIYKKVRTLRWEYKPFSNSGNRVHSEFHLTGIIYRRWMTPVDSSVEYYPNGQLRCKLHYTKKGKWDGKCIYYYDNGQIQREETYSNSNIITIRIFCKNGNLYEIINYKNPSEGYNMKDMETGNCDLMDYIYGTLEFNNTGNPKIIRAKF